MADEFWTKIAAQLKELESAATADDVLRILARKGGSTVNGAGFFAGSGGDDTVDDALTEAGWRYVWSKANYWWAMKAPDGSIITYIEGDIYRGDQNAPSDADVLREIGMDTEADDLDEHLGGSF